MNTYQFNVFINNKDNEVTQLHELKNSISLPSQVTVEANNGRWFYGKVRANNELEAKQLVLKNFEIH